MPYHHGTETKKVDGGSNPIYTVDGAVIGIVGTAPTGPVNELTVCRTMKDFAQFGDASKDESDGFTLPAAFEILSRYKAGTFYVINVYDPQNHNSPSDVSADDVKGGYDIATNKRRGMELLKEGFNRFGTDAKILIAPQLDADKTIAAELEVFADNLKAIAYIDAPVGTKLAEAITGRGPEGTINFNTSNPRVRHFFPHVKNGDTLESLATHAAGLRMKVDVEKGYWWSTSNQNLLGVTDTELRLTARIDDYQSETNALNAVGITTVFNSFGTGFRLWGNRSACFPAVTHIKNFETAMRTGDLIDESIRRFELQYVDRPIDDALIDSLVESIDTYLRTLQSIVGYSVQLDPDYGATELVDFFSKGQIPLMYDYTPKIPAERITNKSVMTRKYLVNLVSSS
ncbi:MAG: phage tail sheath subtilisin-like domain-containing protein [Gammaproteobacteria bacterium]|nr:phage tail sheath subtilisin-like domain-containing protein [Gammaproteobacteria bacterium]